MEAGSEPLAPPAGTLSRWAFDYVSTRDLATKIAPPPPPDEEEVDAPVRRLSAPGRPAVLRVVRRSSRTPRKGALRDPLRRAQLLHTFWHHELQAAELFCWALLAFPAAPRAFRRGLVGIWRDEVRHMSLYQKAIEVSNQKGLYNQWTIKAQEQLKSYRPSAYPAAYQAGLVSTFEVGRVQRFKKGSGLPIQVPVVDLMEIGAGGGSIAKMSKMGLLQVGPESAGADPGPACYRRDGKDPTVTDADLVLGYLDPQYFLGGTMLLDEKASEGAIQEKVAKPLGTSITEAAFGIHDLINETMAAAAKTHIAEKGGNPKIVTISAFGGAGPVHAYGLAKKIGAPRILVPPLAGVGSALGFFTAPVAFDLSRSHRVPLDSADFVEIERLFGELETEGEQILQQADKAQGIIYERTLMMRFVGQGAETDLALENKPFNRWEKNEIRALFDRVYEKLYGRTYPETPVEFVTFKVRVSLPDRPFRIPPLEKKGGNLKDCLKGQRQAFSLLEKDYIPFQVYDRLKLFPGAHIDGPAIIEEKESTVVIGEDAKASVDEYGFVWIDCTR